MITRASLNVIYIAFTDCYTLSSDDRPGVTSPLRSSRQVCEFQAVWSFLLLVCPKYFCCNYLKGRNSRSVDRIDQFSSFACERLKVRKGTFSMAVRAALFVASGKVWLAVVLSRARNTYVDFAASRTTINFILFNVAWLTLN